MKYPWNTETTLTSPPARRRTSLILSAALLAFTGSAAPARADRHSHDRDHRDQATRYLQVNLVSDLPGAAVLQDTNLVNAWGMAFSPTSPFWVSANETGRAVLYSVTNDSLGAVVVAKLGLEVTIPGEGNPTGQLFNSTTNFHGDVFIFVSEDGTISGWRGALGTAAETLATRPGAVYKGVTLASTREGLLLLAANFSEGTVDAYDGNLNLVRQFSDHRVRAGFAPFNVQTIEGIVFVTFALQDDEKEDDVPGPGNGLIEVLNLHSGKFHRFAAGSNAGGKLEEINSPWGVALAPDGFGKHSGRLLVGNFGSGTIMSFDADGDFRGLLKGIDQQPIHIGGLWGLAFGNGGRAGSPDTLFFTAGPADESHGLFGLIEPVRNRGHDGHDDDDDDD